MSSLNLLELYELRENYRNLNYSVTEINLQLLKLASYPFYLLFMTIFSALMMLKIKSINGNTFKISIGLFSSVIIYYMSNFFHVLGSTERISLLVAIFTPIIILSIINVMMLYEINKK